MATNQEAHISALKESLGSGYDGYSYEGLWHAYWDDQSIASGTWNERMLTWINDQLSTSYQGLPQAMQAFAENDGFLNWISMSSLSLANAAGRFLSNYSSDGQGLSFNFTDDPSIKIQDTGTPANNKNLKLSTDFDAFHSVLPGTSPKILRQADGVVKYGALNLVQSSETAATWTKVNSGVVEDTVTPPSDYDEAGTVSGTSGSGEAYFRTNSITANTGDVLIWDLVLQANGATWAVLRDDFNGGGNTYFDIENGVTGTTAAKHTVSVTDLGDGWYKCRIKFTVTSTTSATFRCYLAEDNNDFLWADRSLASVNFTGAHVFKDPADDTYLKTTTAARYSTPIEFNTSGDATHAVREEAATNLFLNNRSPVTQGVTVTADPYTLSFYGTGSITLSGTHSETLNGTGVNDRVETTFTPTAGTLTCTVSGTVDLVQVEAGSFATSPTITPGSTVTRVKDVFSVAATKFPVGTDNTVYIEGTKRNTDNGVLLHLGQTSNDTLLTGRIRQTTTTSVFTVHNGSLEVANISETGVTTDSNHKYAGTSRENDFAFYVDGVQAGTDVSGTLPSAPTALYIGSGPSTYDSHVLVKGFSVIPERVSNTDLASMTT